MTNIINLKDYSDIYKREECEYDFVKAYATDSRLMGVIGVRIHFESKSGEKLTLFFHLDFEEYGFDHFEVYKHDNDETINIITQSIMGGLGAKLIPITFENASALIYSAVDVGGEYSYDIPLEFFEYEYLIDDFCDEVTVELLSKVTTDIRSDEELINYFIMRTAGMDYEIRNNVLSTDEMEYSLVDEPTVLLKNEIFKEEGYYISKSLIDYLDAYKMIISEIEIKDNRVTGCTKVDEMDMTSKEAAFQLNKKENLLVFYVESPLEFKTFLENMKPDLLKNVYESGSLYTEFNKTNDHVNNEVFYLNGDVFGTYYITDEHHVVVSCFDRNCLTEIRDKFLASYSKINELSELTADMPILYNFVTSGYLDFYEFLGE